MSDTFDLLPWHDAELLKINIDRQNAGQCDEVKLLIKWPKGDVSSVIFRECRALNLEMNFGIIAEEAILNASLINDDPQLIHIKSLWKKVGVPLDHLQCYRLETSSTASIMKIYAEQMDVIPFVL